MSPMMLLAVMLVLAMWVMAAYAIWMWGPRMRRQSVWCPVLKKPAKVVAKQRERMFRGSYAGLKIADIEECSLLKGTGMECQKECLQHS